ERELQAPLVQALAGFDGEMQQQFALLSLLGAQSFSLESAAALRTPECAANVPLAQLIQAALDMGQFVRHSLLELVHEQAALSPLTLDAYFPNTATRYQMHPLLHAYALSCLKNVAPQAIQAARSNAQFYAMAYIEQYREDVGALEQERAFLLAVLEQAWEMKQYELVVRLVEGFTPLLGRFGMNVAGEQVLLWGIRASQQMQMISRLAQ